jgi:hypothetical protein
MALLRLIRQSDADLERESAEGSAQGEKGDGADGGC